MLTHNYRVHAINLIYPWMCYIKSILSVLSKFVVCDFYKYWDEKHKTQDIQSKIFYVNIKMLAHPKHNL